ncbi:MAG: ABC transporter ATP-binding protein [Symploca sp. SIO2G7]|nr:ABC transporter ATP-binding protein [Symploca sp. SIO2G7]
MGFQISTSVRKLLKTTSFWQDNYWLIREFSHFQWIVVLAILFALLAAIFEGLGLGFLLAFLQTFLEPNSEPFQTGISWFDIWILGVNTSEANRLYRGCGLVLGATWIRAGFNYLTQVYMELVRINMTHQLNQRLFEQFQSLNLSFFGKSNSGEIINSITNEMSELKYFFPHVGFLITKTLTLLVYVFVMLKISWQLSLISILLFSLLAVGLLNLNRRVRETSFPVTKANGKFISIAVEFINGIRSVQAFATQEFERKRFYQASNSVVSTSITAAKSLAIVRPLAEGLASTVLIGMIIVAITVFVANGVLQTAGLMTFLFTLFRVVPAVHELNLNSAELSKLRASMVNIQELLRTDNKPYLENGDLPFSGLKQSIEFVSVDFGYDANDLVLHNITLTIEKGQTIALVGASGAGKSTLVDLIPRFYEPTQGKVLIDDVDLREWEINSVRRRMAIVSQDTFIFNASIRDNIAYGSEGADEAAIWEVAELANATEFIQKMPEGLDTSLGDRGVRLSGGQRQRIAIARALLRNPEILILDEATSALDSVSEKLIQESLEKLAVGRTVIAIAHRLSTIARADTVVVLEQGQIVEQGGYQELLEKRGKLWQYHQMQYQLEHK